MQVRRLTWRPYGAPEPVLRDVTLDLEPGERVLLAGPSGSGKSSLLRALGGLLLTADAGDLDGEVLLDGADPQARPGTVGLVLQDPGSGVVASTVGRDVAFGLENLGLPPAAMAAPVAEALRDVRLDLPLSTPPSTLSGGEQQRLALAGALALAPRLLLLDEPLAMLDEATATTVRDVVVDVAARRGLTLVVVEHRLGPWLDHVDRLVVLGPGGVPLADGEPEQVMSQQADALLAAGVWLPGRPDPAPTALDLRWGPPEVAPGEPVASAHRVTVRRTSRTLSGPARETLAVDRADLDVPAGRVSALVGPSGAGKSTLMATVGGLVAPDTGSVSWATEAARPPHRLPARDLAARVAWVPQRAASTVVARTVRDEVLATPRALGRDDAETRARADALLEGLGLAHRAGLDPRRLSGGEQRRLALAAAAVHQPALLLADEPTVGQDRHTWAAVTGVLASLRAAGSGVLVTTHDAGLVARADTVHRVERPVAPPAAEAAVRSPLAARCGPLALLLASALVLPLPAVLTSWTQGLLVLVAELLLAGVALAAPGEGARPGGRLRRLATRLVGPVVGVAGVVWSTWLLGGHDVAVAAGAGLRVLTMVVPSVVLLAYVDPDALGDHLAQRLRLPARPVVAISVALQRFQALGDLWAELRTARRVRGVGGGRSPLARGRDVLATTFGLLVGALDDAAVLAVAMDARGFGAAHERTWAGGAPWHRRDTVVVLLGLVPLLVAVAGRLLLPG
ncbi:ATP-binding cassette domain-containing protein [Lapillicoccus jejuensis]|uniref:Energy-coupling factor transport system ATP-binding protein n=1 Tax=Lapillicoccus jejuensis TaxID=402171 RepID=A0A542DZU2_9MICO|nr:ATP-binding cassette domain-containing protein [Lapillicoccus jejuensis]TQJ08593.1 energy-coupling factor transport system ATP-binding protein [Lapillicoccus jejuensis]